jgi:non-ribosomal peptide synthetase component E (peptide arylation enzyme)
MAAHVGQEGIMAQAVEERVAMGETLNQFLEERARRFGPRTALLFKPGFRYQRWSYAQLWEGAGRVASLLKQRGL